jgi:transposase
MTLHQQHEFSIPEETACVARAAYPKGNLHMRDARCAMLWERCIWISPLPTSFHRMGVLWRLACRLACMTVVPFIEGLPYRQAADAVRGRIESRVRPQLRADRSRL